MNLNKSSGAVTSDRCQVQAELLLPVVSEASGRLVLALHSNEFGYEMEDRVSLSVGLDYNISPWR